MKKQTSRTGQLKDMPLISFKLSSKITKSRKEGIAKLLMLPDLKKKQQQSIPVSPVLPLGLTCIREIYMISI